MLYDLSWLDIGQSFPPASELDRLQRYEENRKMFHVEHLNENLSSTYSQYVKRIERVVGNFDEIISFPVILAYQRLLSLKTADLVCGEYPSIQSTNDEETDKIEDMREEIDLDSQLYASVLDLSSLGDAVWRIYKDEFTGKGSFTVWDPKGWFPIVMNDGTNRVKQHVLCWSVNVGTVDEPYWNLHVQIHNRGHYDELVLDTGNHGNEIVKVVSEPRRVPTGLNDFAVIHLRAFKTSDTVYGQDDYSQIDSLVAEIMARIGQISKILDKHADPALTGPVSMLTVEEDTGRTYLKTGSFYATSVGEVQPKYLVWEGQLGAAFEELELLLQQLYILSEMGSSLLDAGSGGTGTAISGTAMRFKMVNPMVKARRVTNALTFPLKKLLEGVSTIGHGKIENKDISIQWKDGLPDDPRETVELVRLITGAKQIDTLERALQEYYDKSAKDAKEIIEGILEEKEQLGTGSNPESGDDGMPHPNRKGSEQGLNNFSGMHNPNPAVGGR